MAGESVTNTPQRLRPWRWGLVILMLFAFALRIFDLGEQELWFDEALSANISTLGWQGTVAHLQNEPFEHPPLYFLALFPWLSLAGTSELALRYFSLFWGVLFLPLLYLLVRRLADERLAFLSALLAAISPFMVAYSQEARMYTLLPLLAMLLLLSLHNILKQDGHPGWLLAYMAFLVLGIATNYFFALMWVATSVFLLFEWRHRPKRWGWVAAIQLLVLLIAAIWLLAAPGLRSSLVRLIQGEAVFGLDYKLNKVIPALMVAESPSGRVPWLARIVALGGWVLVVLGAWQARRARILDPQAWRLLMAILVIPLLLALVLPYGVLGRHLGYVLIAVFPFVAVALLALSRRGRLLFATGIALVLLSATYGLVIHYTTSNGDLKQALAYIDQHGQAGDQVIMTQPAQRYQVGYYNDLEWPVRFLPEQDVLLTAEQVGEVLGSVCQAQSRLWLGPIGAWTADPEHLVEQWLVANAYQAEKTWFPESSSVAVYYSHGDDLVPIRSEQPTWGGSIRLRGIQAAPLQVLPGDAVRIRFDWQVGLDLEDRYAAHLRLVDQDGLIWAERSSEPCGGWCATDAWMAGQIQRDQHALLIPRGTPPGTYGLEVAWTTLDGGGTLPVQVGNGPEAQAQVAEVAVMPAPAGSSDRGMLPNSMQVEFGGELTLLGYELPVAQASPGGNLYLETHWQAVQEPAGDHILLVELVDGQGDAVAGWEVSPSASYYPTSMWQAGEYLRGQYALELPGTLPPGRYIMRVAMLSPGGERLALAGEGPSKLLAGLVPRQEQVEGKELPLASVHVTDRPRLFQVPKVTHPLDATVGQNAQLLGYDLGLDQAQPGGQVVLTLYWQAGGPMVQAYKVFTHLVDSASSGPVAQHDGPPGGGCCPANTWTESEVIVDQHVVSLGADLPPGTYELVAGMYDEETDTRLPVFDGDGNQLPHERVTISRVVVEPAGLPGEGTSAPEGPRFGTEFVIYLPVMSKAQE